MVPTILKHLNVYNTLNAEVFLFSPHIPIKQKNTIKGGSLLYLDIFYAKSNCKHLFMCSFNACNTTELIQLFMSE
jgi:hypothetical protein